MLLLDPKPPVETAVPLATKPLEAVEVEAEAEAKADADVEAGAVPEDTAADDEVEEEADEEEDLGGRMLVHNQVIQ